MRCVSQLDSTASQMFKQFAILPPKMPKLIHVNPSFHLWGGSIAGVEHQQLGYLHTFAIPGYWMVVEKRRAEYRIPTWPVQKVVMYYTQCHKPTIWGWFESHHISSICIIPMVPHGSPWFPLAGCVGSRGSWRLLRHLRPSIAAEGLWLGDIQCMEAIAAQSQRTPGTIGYHCWEDWKDANGF